MTHQYSRVGFNAYVEVKEVNLSLSYGGVLLASYSEWKKKVNEFMLLTEVIGNAPICLYKHDGEYSHSSGLVTWVRNKSCQPDLHFSEQTDVAGGTTTLQLGTDVVDLDSGDFPDVTSSDVEDDVNLRGRVLIVLSQACDSLILTPPLRFSDGFSARTHMASLTPRSNQRVSLSIILTSSKSVLCPLAFKWSKTAETLDPEVCCNLLRSGWDVSPM